jgi:hypothetical protein
MILYRESYVYFKFYLCTTFGTAVPKVVQSFVCVVYGVRRIKLGAKGFEVLFTEGEEVAVWVGVFEYFG